VPMWDSRPRLSAGGARLLPRSTAIYAAGFDRARLPTVRLVGIVRKGTALKPCRPGPIKTEALAPERRFTHRRSFLIASPAWILFEMPCMFARWKLPCKRNTNKGRKRRSLFGADSFLSLLCS
jgi:hypothetical protein